jgi:cytochrome d ubiquinol oxidase subunit II
LSAVCVTAGYSFIGGAWLVMKTEGELQLRAVRWTRRCGIFTASGIILVSIVNPLINPAIFTQWFGSLASLPLLIIPTLCAGLFVLAERFLKNLAQQKATQCWVPFAAVVGIFLLCFTGLGLSFFPFIVPNQMTIWQAASAPESLLFILYGTALVLPTILLYSIYSYRVFWGKATQLNYY